jgi:hypothetical protein
MASVIGIIPAAVILIMLRQAVPLHPRLTLAVAALAVASIANFGLQFAHVGDASIMVLVWHLGASPTLAGVGGWLGDYVLGWRSAQASPG